MQLAEMIDLRACSARRNAAPQCGVKDFRTLEIWRRSHRFALRIYEETRSFPKQEMFGLTSQMRRAVTSIGANIAEGCGRDGDAELKRFLTIALGSACEIDNFLMLARDLGYLDAATANEAAVEILEIRRMIGRFIQKLKA
jgi:four helix bundle protein